MMEYFIYGLVWGIFWEWFNRQQGQPLDDFSRVMHVLLWPVFLLLFITGWINGFINGGDE